MIGKFFFAVSMNLGVQIGDALQRRFAAIENNNRVTLNRCGYQHWVTKTVELMVHVGNFFV
jgi:hypothetical protein